MTTATLTVQPTETNVADLTDKEQALAAMSQLVSVIVGAKTARVTDSLRDRPKARVQKAIEMALAEYQLAAAQMASSPDGQKAVKQVQRKLDSLNSLAVMANLIEEVDWD